ncbi:DUF427 domain-containing protein [soil metagenome]
MATRMRDALMRELDALRFEPTQKRIRGQLAGETVIDSARAMLVWEPRRVVPTYAVPGADLAVELLPVLRRDPADTTSVGVAPMGAPQLLGQRVLDPSVPFAVRTTDGEPLTIRAAGSVLEGAAFRPTDPALADYIIVDFDALDAWYEEEERNVGHPRDPFHAIDIVHSSRRVRVEHDGTVLAESTRPHLLFEPPLPIRYYLPAEDVRTDLLQPSPTRSVCAYKGQASYWSLPAVDDIAWSYPQPLRQTAEIAGRVTFFNERVDITVDGVALERPVTPWST